MVVRIPKRLSKAKSPAKKANRQEARIANRIGGEVTKASGSGPFEKGDVRLKGIARIEAKTTRASSFRVTTEMIEKIEAHALQAGEVPVIEIELADGAKTVALIPIWALDTLLNGAK